MIQSFSQWTTTELNFPKVPVHFLSVCDEWLRLPGNSDPLSHSLNSHITFSTKQVAAHFSKIKKKKKSKNVALKLNIWESNVLFQILSLKFSFFYETYMYFLQEYLFSVNRPYLVFCVTARWGPGLIQACQWHSIAQQLLVAVTPWPAFPLRCE